MIFLRTFYNIYSSKFKKVKNYSEKNLTNRVVFRRHPNIYIYELHKNTTRSTFKLYFPNVQAFFKFYFI